MTEPFTCERRLARSALPRSAVLELTYRCNHACRFCSCPWYAAGGAYEVRPELSVAEWQQAIAGLCERGVTDLAFTGGEPLLKEGLADILSFAAGCSCEHFTSVEGKLLVRTGAPRLSLLSNGKALNPGILDLCRQHDIRLSLSLPGLAWFADHTGGGESQRVLEGFQAAHALGLRTTVGVTVTRRNLDELYETIATALLAGAGTLLLNRFLPGGRGLAHARDLVLDAAGVVRMLDTAEEVLGTANRYGSIGTELPRCLLGAPTDRSTSARWSERYRHLEVGSRCSAATGFFAVDPSGYVRVCNHSPVRLEHISHLDRLAENAYWQTFVKREYAPRACQGCALGFACDAGCREAAHILTGRVDGDDPLLAEMHR
jgi:radical SAM protein with 4Fe4S-binding SPASM domain